MSKADSLKLVGLAILSVYFCLSVGWRHRSELKKWLSEWPERREYRRRCREFLRESPHTGIDASAILPRIEQLRHAHVGAAQARFYHHYDRRGLLRAARRMVMRLAYFRRAEPETSDTAEHAQEHEP